MPFEAQYYALLLVGVGMRDSAVAVVRRAVEVNPTSVDVLGKAASVYLNVGRLSEARAACLRARELAPADECLTRQLIAEGKYAEALAVLQGESGQTYRGVTLRRRLDLAEVLTKLGRTDEAKRIMDDLEREYTRHYVREDWISLTYAELGDRRKALDWLERAYNSNSSGVAELYFHKAWEPLRSDPRFIAIAKKAGVPIPPGAPGG